MTARLLTVSADQYHADQIGDGPTLSSSIAHKLITRTPAHARAAHPKLNPALERDDDPKFDLGKAVHALLLEGDAAVDVYEFKTWQSNDAKAAKAESRSYGRIPMLGAQWDNCQAVVEAVRAQLQDFPADPPPFTQGTAEQTVAWSEDGVACRARLDWLHDDYATVDDLKTSSVTAPGWMAKVMFDNGCDLQAAFYRRGVRALTGRDPAWRWIFVEKDAPFALRVIRPDAAVLALGDAKVDLALNKWKTCLETGDWPAYPREIVDAELPARIESAWLEREAMEALAA